MWSIVQAHGAHFIKKIELIEKIQHRFTKMIINMESKSYDDRLRYLGLWTFEERRHRHDLIELFKMKTRKVLRVIV